MKKFTFIFCVLLPTVGFSQNAKTPYTINFVFKDGIYLNLNQFTENKPISIEAIISTLSKNQTNFLDEVVKQKQIIYIDSLGKQQQIESNALWGYCQNKIVHINYNKKFARINVIGTLCQFTAVVTTMVTYQSPMYMGMPGGGFGTTTSAVDEMKQFILDTRNNDIGDFSEQNMEAILQDDQELYKEYMNLKRRQRKDSVFIYLRKYNDRHPLLLPSK